MSDSFDPYYRWLGIPPAEQPPNHYRLLGLELFESSREVIDSVAMRHIAYLQDITDGPHVKEAQRLLNELAAARRCLLDAEARAPYDRTLRDQLAKRTKPPQAEPPGARPRKGPASSPDPPSPPRPVVRPSQGGAKIKTQAKPQVSPFASLKVFWIAVGATIGLVGVLAIGMSVFLGDETPTLSVDTSHREEVAVDKAPADSSAQTETPLAQADPIRDAKEQLANWNAGAITHDDSPPEVDNSLTSTPTSGASASPADPASASPIPTEGLVLWLDAADESTLDTYRGRVRTWSDRSETSSDAESALAAERPSVVADDRKGRAVIHFDGTHAMGAGKGDTLNVGADFTIFHVARGERGTLMSKGYGERESQFSLVDGGCTLLVSGQRCGVGEQRAADFAVRAIVADGRSVTGYHNGAVVETIDCAGCQIETRYKFRIGCQTVTGVDLPDAFVGDLAELLVYDVALKGTDREAVEDYLRAKWLSGEPAEPTQEITELVQAAPNVAPSQPPIEETANASLELSKSTEETESSFVETQEEPAPPAKIDWCVNVGGEEYVDPESGLTWLACPGEGFDCEGGRKASDENALNPVMGTAERGLNAFRADVPNGVYDVHLYFCDYWTSDPSSRAFHIAVEQKVVRMNFSVVMAAGGSDNPTTIPVLKVPVNDGRLDVDFRAQVGTTILNGVRIQQR